MTDADAGDVQQLKSVDRAFKVIEYLRANGPARLSEIAAEFDMPMSTAHVYLSTLCETEYVTKREQKYECSLRFLWTGGLLRDEIPLFQVAKSEIDDLQNDIGEHANVAIEQNWYMIQLYKSENPESIDDNASVGAHLHLHTTASGKAMLSRWSEEAIDELVRRRGLPKQTENTITDRDTLVSELEEVREQEYAINDAEHHHGVRAIGTPIISNSGDAIGAISVSGPLSRITTERIEDAIVPKIFNKKNIIELKL